MISCILWDTRPSTTVFGSLVLACWDNISKHCPTLDRADIMLTPTEGAVTTYWCPTQLLCQLYLLYCCWNCCHMILLTLESLMPHGNLKTTTLFSFTDFLKPWNLCHRMLGAANTGQQHPSPLALSWCHWTQFVSFDFSLRVSYFPGVPWPLL